ncbi:septum site-determining protein MinC [Gordoniibacillus kamchatkensis]|uniref:Probable septum site-determining protein MinC n=1 Tax=Gordoniibacillus kamchatkensis TaxID=1590651 RepID=A0ABR5AKX8_9BACL|nr:septum site-determining protein MinC [Paenibacillus sp. VKM B-2647]KIL41022.1 septum site-determining protein MinC [Paenibacillus sp. VKM B-2647]
MTADKHHVTIKGIKDGLVFRLDDSCSWEELLEELQHKLEKTHQQILTGPIIHVHVKLGKRAVSEEEKGRIRAIIGTRGNLLIQSIESETGSETEDDRTRQPLKLVKGIVRSGQVLRHNGHLLFLGDVNPGGTIECTGSIYVLGALRGMAHAGSEGDEEAVIAASYLRPTQLRIAGIISRPPDEWGIDEAYMEFAYIQEGRMEIDKLQHLARIRPDSAIAKPLTS